MLIDKTSIIKISLILTLVGNLIVTNADEPMSAPETTIIVSPNKKIYAVLDVNAKIIKIHKKTEMVKIHSYG